MYLSLELKKLENPKRAKVMQGFFKTGKGEYGEGDVFLGVSVPQTRSLAKRFSNSGFSELKKLLSSKIHEERLLALFVLVEKFKKGSEAEKKHVFGFYIDNLKGVNNWDLVDLSAYKIVGEYLFNRDKKILFEFSKSKNMWERRISIVSTYAFIKKNSFETTFEISELLLGDKEDLIHKAVGWMLREAGKRNQEKEEEFLKKHYKRMPRTMLRYSIEKFPEKKRKSILGGNY